VKPRECSISLFVIHQQPSDHDLGLGFVCVLGPPELHHAADALGLGDLRLLLVFAIHGNLH